MPSKTPKQHRAMAAASEGRSSLGIPKKVGKEFIKADKGKPVTKEPAASTGPSEKVSGLMKRMDGYQ